MAAGSDDPFGGHVAPLDADKEREFICDECGARCTRGTDPADEYGHLDGCPERPKDYRRGGN